jgi:hypothetical protein
MEQASLNVVRASTQTAVVWKRALTSGSIAKLSTQPPKPPRVRYEGYSGYGYGRYGYGGFYDRHFGGGEYDSDRFSHDEDEDDEDDNEDEDEDEDENDDTIVIGRTLPGGAPGSSSRKGVLLPVANRSSAAAYGFPALPTTLTSPSASRRCDTCGFSQAAMKSFCSLCGLLVEPAMPTAAVSAVADTLAVLSVTFEMAMQGPQSTVPPESLEYIKSNWASNPSWTFDTTKQEKYVRAHIGARAGSAMFELLKNGTITIGLVRVSANSIDWSSSHCFQRHFDVTAAMAPAAAAPSVPPPTLVSTKTPAKMPPKLRAISSVAKGKAKSASTPKSHKKYSATPRTTEEKARCTQPVRYDVVFSDERLGLNIADGCAADDLPYVSEAPVGCKAKIGDRVEAVNGVSVIGALNAKDTIVALVGSAGRPVHP